MEELKKFRHPGAMLQGHPDMKNIPGIDMSTGSLGQGFSAACGMALAAKLDQKDYRVYAVYDFIRHRQGRTAVALPASALLHSRNEVICRSCITMGL